jgi:hypothetical protein
MTFNETGSEGTTVSFNRTPSSVEAGTTANFPFEVSVGEANINSSLDVEVKAFLYVAGTNDVAIQASTSSVTKQNTTVEGGLSFTFPTNQSRNETIGQERTQTGRIRERFNSYPRTDEPIWIKVEVDYYGEPGFSRGTVNETASTGAESINVTDPTADPEVAGFEDDAGTAAQNTLAKTFQDRTPFSIKEISYEDDATYLSSVYRDAEVSNNQYRISFDDYPNPTVSIDTSGRFAKHEIIGGATVRQKIGEDPINISVNGVCKRRTANQIDSLRDAKSGKIFSDRLPGSNDALRVQFGSTMTEPLSDGGAADIEDGEYLYSFQINAIEVIR